MYTIKLIPLQNEFKERTEAAECFLFNCVGILSECPDGAVSKAINALNRTNYHDDIGKVFDVQSLNLEVYPCLH